MIRVQKTSMNPKSLMFFGRFSKFKGGRCHMLSFGEFEVHKWPRKSKTSLSRRISVPRSISNIIKQLTFQVSILDMKWTKTSLFLCHHGCSGICWRSWRMPTTLRRFWNSSMECWTPVAWPWNHMESMDKGKVLTPWYKEWWIIMNNPYTVAGCSWIHGRFLKKWNLVQQCFETSARWCCRWSPLFIQEHQGRLVHSPWIGPGWADTAMRQESFVENLVSPISAAVERFGDKATDCWWIDGKGRSGGNWRLLGFFFPNLTILGCYSPGHPRASLERFT